MCSMSSTRTGVFHRKTFTVLYRYFGRWPSEVKQQIWRRLHDGVQFNNHPIMTIIVANLKSSSNLSWFTEDGLQPKYF